MVGVDRDPTVGRFPYWTKPLEQGMDVSDTHSLRTALTDREEVARTLNGQTPSAAIAQCLVPPTGYLSNAPIKSQEDVS